MAGWSTKDTDEELATRVIQLALRVPVIQHDDRAGTSEYDLKILYPGGPHRGRRGSFHTGSGPYVSRQSGQEARLCPVQ